MVCQARLRQTLDSHQMDPSTNDPPTMAMRSEAVAGCTLMPHSCRTFASHFKLLRRMSNCTLPIQQLGVGRKDIYFLSQLLKMLFSLMRCTL